jgi:hypothetical protein
MMIPSWLISKGINLVLSFLNGNIVYSDSFKKHLLQDSSPYPYPYPYPEATIVFNEPSMTGLIIGAVVIVAIILIGIAVRQPRKDS